MFTPVPVSSIVSPPSGWQVHARLTLPGPEATADLAQAIAPLVRPGDTLLLQGDLGAGKSHLARSLIRARLGAGGALAEVPSPTFTLVQTYEAPDAEIWHADLYRLSDPQELWELGLDGAMETAICLIEWPDRIAPDWPDTAVCLSLETPAEAPETRVLELWAPATSRLAARLLPAVRSA